MRKNILSKRSNNNTPQNKVIKTREVLTGKFIDVDKIISDRAKKGQLASSGENAIRRSLKRGLSVTVLEDGTIYRVHPDGTKTRVKNQPQIYRDSKTGKFYKKK
jgi:hypothetical protein